MQDEFRGMVISLAGALIFFGAAFWVLDLGGIWSFFLGALVYGGLLLLTKPRRRLGGIDVEQIPGFRTTGCGKAPGSFIKRRGAF